MTIEPLFDRVVINRGMSDQPGEKTTAGGLFIPETATKETPFTGTVVAVGPDCKVVKVNDRVVYGKFSGGEMVDPDGSGTKVLVVKESDVYAVLK